MFSGQSRVCGFSRPISGLVVFSGHPGLGASFPPHLPGQSFFHTKPGEKSFFPGQPRGNSFFPRPHPGVNSFSPAPIPAAKTVFPRPSPGRKRFPPAHTGVTVFLAPRENFLHSPQPALNSHAGYTVLLLTKKLPHLLDGCHPSTRDRPSSSRNSPPRPPADTTPAGTALVSSGKLPPNRGESSPPDALFHSEKTPPHWGRPTFRRTPHYHQTAAPPAHPNSHGRWRPKNYHPLAGALSSRPFL